MLGIQFFRERETHMLLLKNQLSTKGECLDSEFLYIVGD